LTQLSAAKFAWLQAYESDEGSAELIVSGGNAAELLELIEEAFDVVALAIDSFLPSVLLFAVGAVRNVGDGPLSPDMRTNAVGSIDLSMTLRPSTGRRFSAELA